MNNLLSYVILLSSGLTMLILVSMYWTKRFNNFLKIEKEQRTRSVFLSAQMISVLITFYYGINQETLNFLQGLTSNQVETFLVLKHFGFIVILFISNVVLCNVLSLISIKYLFMFDTSINELIRSNSFYSIFQISIFYLGLIFLFSYFIISPLLSQIIVIKSAFIPMI
jgi:hypothetical protein